MALAAGELESTQLVVRVAKNASVGISFSFGADWPAEHLRLDWKQVGYVEVKDISRPDLIEPERGPGWWPDPLLPVPRLLATAGEAGVAWRKAPEYGCETAMKCAASARPRAVRS